MAEWRERRERDRRRSEPTYDAYPDHDRPQRLPSGPIKYEAPPSRAVRVRPKWTGPGPRLLLADGDRMVRVNIPLGSLDLSKRLPQGWLAHEVENAMDELRERRERE